MLKLTNIVKDYKTGDTFVHALRSINLEFRQSEFVAVLGQSGCGKTTLLNIIGGLDRYTSGDLTIDGVSTKNYRDVDWDAYRNIRVGFIFQSYNLISHIDILSNVEMALVLAGVGKEERKQRAMKALEEVGLAEQVHKMPNQLSGGQMQRVSIARALINNPEIILADEPTGALDSATSVQIMELLKKISTSRLIIMVTHNPELADAYSNRIVRLNDGEVVADSNPYCKADEILGSEQAQQNCVKSSQDGQQNVVCDGKEQAVHDETQDMPQTTDSAKKKRKNKKKSMKKTSMSYITALKLSFKNLMTKKGRTVMTSIAGSIGIIGVALVLAISNGLSGYISDMQHDVLAGYPIQVARENFDSAKLLSMVMGGGATADSPSKFPDDGNIFPYDPSKNWSDMISINNITQEYVDYINGMDKKMIDSVKYSYGIDMNVLCKVNTSFSGFEDQAYAKVSRTTSQLESILGMAGGGSGGGKEKPDINWQQMSGDENYILNQYDNIAGRFPKEMNEVVLVVDSSNQVNQSTLASMGLKYSARKVKFEDVLGVDGVGGVKLKVVTNNAMYTYDDAEKYYKTNDMKSLYENGGEGVIDIKVVGILRQKKDAKLTTLNPGIAYLSSMTDYMLQDGLKSDIVKAQKAESSVNMLTGKRFNFLENPLLGQRSVLERLGGSEIPTVISVYPKDFDSKEKVLTYLNGWNAGKPMLDQIKYNDMSKFATDIMSQTVNIISIALICFAAVSLLVSSVMIGIITYVSVVERTKEIGILRSLGARKIDITNVFNAETAIIGFAAGLFGVVMTYILSIPINLIIYSKIQIATLCMLSPLHAVLLILTSVILTVIAGLVPSFMASKRDPVVALRTE